MTEHSESQARPSWWRRHPILFTGALVLVLFLGFLAFNRWSAGNEIDRELARIQAEGMPTDLLELELWYEHPAGPNAAHLYEHAFPLLQKPSGNDENLPGLGRADLPELGEPLPEVMKQAMREYVDANREARDLLRQAAAIEESRYSIRLSMGWNTPLFHLSELKRSVQFLRIEAVLAADEGEFDRAILAIRDSLAASNSLSQEPVLISWMVRAGCHSIAVDTLEHVLNAGELESEQLEELDRLFAPPHPEAELHRTLAGERCFGISLFQAPLSFGGGMPGEAAPVVGLYEAVGFLDRDFAFYLQVLNRNVEASKLALPKQLAVAETNEDLLNQSRLPIVRIFSRMMIPALGKVPKKAATLKGTLNAARIALAIERYRLDHTGDIPSHLDELVPNYLVALPEDPFTGEAMIFRRTDPGYIISSRGLDGEDDGGVRAGRPSSNSSSVDSAFEVRR